MVGNILEQAIVRLPINVSPLAPGNISTSHTFGCSGGDEYKDSCRSYVSSYEALVSHTCYTSPEKDIPGRCYCGDEQWNNNTAVTEYQGSHSKDNFF